MIDREFAARDSSRHVPAATTRSNVRRSRFRMQMALAVLFLVFPDQLISQTPGLPVGPDTARVHPGARQPALMLDADLGMRSGIESIIMLHRGFSLVADRVVGRQWFAESTAVARSAAVLGRVGRYALLDLPAAYFTVILGHEFTGHGARYRELGVTGVDYGIDWPPPYGPGGGHASTDKPLDLLGELAVWSGGLEFNGLLQQRLGLRWMAREELEFADALLFWWSWRFQEDYVQGSSDFGPNQADNDPRAYVRLVNEMAGLTDVADFRWTLADLKRVHRLNAVNPFLALALYA